MRSVFAACCLLVAGAGPLAAETAPAGREESLAQAMCRLIETAARHHNLPISFFTRLIWQESGFRTGAVSPRGAQGIAQFMPGTAAERALSNPFDPEEAIPKSAELLADHRAQFGNLGLAAAAYNAGPTRVANWLAGRGGMPLETINYVISITGHPIEAWAAPTPPERAAPGPDSCLAIAAARPSSRSGTGMAEGPIAPWGVQLSGNFNRAVALASFARQRAQLAAVIGSQRPMVIGQRVRSMGPRVYYRVRLPARTREAALALCDRIRAAGGACLVLRS